MIFGGIPYYLGYFDGSLSLAQNVDATLFARRAPLADEFDRLFASLFTNPGAMQAIVRFLGTRSSGYTRHEIANGAGVSEGGGLSHSLKALIASDFVVKYVPFGSSAREQRYRLVDPFCLFCLHFLDKGASNDDHFWQNNLTSQSVVVWRGLAFENVCFTHVDQIKAALGVSGVSTTSSAWARRADESGPGILVARKPEGRHQSASHDYLRRDQAREEFLPAQDGLVVCAAHRKEPADVFDLTHIEYVVFA